MGDEGNGDDIYHNGAFFLAANFGFYSGFWPHDVKAPRFDRGTPDDYEFFLRMGPLANANALYFKHKNPFWDDLLEHPNYDSFWASRALGPVMTNLTVPVLVVGGWYDAEDLGGTFKLFQAINKLSDAPAATLVMGPWSHGEWGAKGGQKLGDLDFGSGTCDFFQTNIQYPFFVQTLEPNSDTDFQLPKAWLFETGRNQWRQFDSLASKKRQTTHALSSIWRKTFLPRAIRVRTIRDEYGSAPATPGPVTSEMGGGMPGDYMTRDQRFASHRTDVLTYETEPLKHDLTIAGPIKPVLRVSTSGTDSDFDVKLIDVYPDDTPDPNPNPKGIHFAGYQQLVRGEPFRGKFRNSMSTPQPFIPNEPTKIEFVMPDVLHTFLKGHRIMVQIQSSWFPMVDLNPQQFENIPTAKATDFQKASERVFYGGSQGTHIDLLTIPPDAKMTM